MTDTASYVCVAENLAGSAEKVFTLRVQGELGRAGPAGPPTKEGLYAGGHSSCILKCLSLSWWLWGQSHHELQA